jgi:hypothetical protein
MKRIAMFLLSLSATALMAQTTAQTTPAVSQERAIIPPVVASKCTITTTDLEGVVDSFAPGIDPTSLSPALTAFLTANPPKSQYDEPGCDKHFGESFRLCTCETCGGRLEIQVRKCSSTLVSNDGYVIGVAPFGPNQRVVQGQVWAPGDPNTKTLVIQLPNPQLSQVLCANNTQWLDIYIQDDTIVDWARLTVLHP